MKFCFVLISILFSLNSFSYVQINPTRFILTGGVKVGHFSVRNTQKKAIIVNTSIKYFEMKPEGGMKEVKVSSSKNALKKVLFSPRSFTVQPGKKQVVRFFIRERLEEGQNELLAYAHFETEVEGKKEEMSKKQMALIPKVALAIPIVFRKETVGNNSTFINAKKKILSENKCEVVIDWKNSTHSSYADFIGMDKDNKQSFIVKGVSNYLSSYKWKHEVKSNCKNINYIIAKDIDSKIETKINL